MRRVIWIALLAFIAGVCQAATVPPVVRGNHAISLRFEGGDLQIKIYKRDLNIYEGADELRATLYDPQRRLVATLQIGDDGAPRGKAATELQSAEATVRKAGAGVYRLQVSCDDCVFGLETNAAGCVLQGDLVFNDGSIGGRVYFAPPAEKFTIKAQALHDSGQQPSVPLLDRQAKSLHDFNLSKVNVDDTFEVEAGERSGLWSFDIGKMDVKIIPSKPLVFALDSSAWFDSAATKWMLLPYRQARYLQPEESATVTFDLRNTTKAAQDFALEVAAEDGVRARLVEAGPVRLEAGAKRKIAMAVTLAKGATAAKQVTLTAKRVDQPAMVTSAGLEVRPGVAPVGKLLDLPIALKPYEHENWQFGYAPEYEPNEIYFDNQNRPYMRQRTEANDGTTGIQVLEDGKWVERRFEEVIKAAYPGYRTSSGGGGFMGAKVAFDGDNGAYTLLRLSIAGQNSQSVLLYTPDAGKSYQLYPIAASAFDIEQFVGHNALKDPPPILLYQFVKEHPAEFAGYYDLKMLLPKKVGGKLVLGEPILIAQNCLGSCQHSGGPASTATRDGKTHIVWGEIAPDDAPGVPTYIATYDQATGKLSEKVLLGYGPPVNDVHNVPAICQDSKGIIHVVIGSHGQAFQYVRSLKPNNISGGFTQARPVLSAGYVDPKTDADGAGRQTYISLVCDQKDALHIAFRQWRRNVDEFHPDRIYAALSVQTKEPGKDWGPAQPIVIPARDNYSIYYHKLTTDRQGRLYLSYSYWTSDETYQGDFPERHHNRAVVMSRDGGKTWKLLETRDLQ
ncbi:MAG: BNR-4 repeat-containing protein [Bacteroidota bacterium]